MDYVTHLKPDGTYQPLREHEENVAALAGEFAAAFGAQEHGHRTGLLHDIGKYSANGQKRQRDPAHTAKVDHASAGAQLAAQLGDPFAAFAVAGHHGGLPDRGDKTNDGGGTLCARLNKHLTGGNDPSAWKTEIEIPAKARFPAWLAAEKDAWRLAMYTRMLFSCLVDADYLDTETAIQGGQPRGEGETPERLLEKLNAHVAPWLEAPANDLCAKRSEILARCLRGGEDERGLYTLTVPTGGGKTLSSLAFALSHAAKHGMKRVIYVIPYTSIIEQNADVFAKVLGAENVLEHHSQIKIPDDEEEETPEAYRKRLACENWDAPVVVTTAVQFFESLYSNRPAACRKLHHLAKSVIVMDEAQMLPVDHLRPCVHALSELSAHYGASVVLCTATQPALTPIFREFQPELSPRELCPDELAVSPVFRRTTITCAGKLSWEELTKRLSGQHQALCIVNSRAGAQFVYERLSGDGVFHLSTLMHPTHRRRVLAEIRRRLKNGERCLVVSTSLIEAGVDVDFPQVFRELAGLDSMLQAAGRCNREGKRPREESIVTVFEAPVAPPPLFLTAIGAARVAMGAYPDLQEPDAIHLYFTELLKLKGENAQDVKDILPMISRGDFPFPWVSEHFQMIDTDTKTVYIPGTDQDPLLEQLRMGWRSRDLFRKLAQYAVSVYPQQFEALNLAGDLEILDDQVAILTNPSLYSEQTGLSLQSDFGKALFI